MHNPTDGENGQPSCSNGWLLNTVLRERWGRPDAVVTTDSGAVKNLMGPPVNASSAAAAAAYALNNGSDVNDGAGFQALPEAVAQGLTTEKHMDVALTRSLTQLFNAGLFDPVDSVSWTKISAEAINSTEHQRINHDAALQAAVLLKNDGSLLPLSSAEATTIAVVGPQADARSGLLSDYASEQTCADGTDGCIVSIQAAIAAEGRRAGGKVKVGFEQGVDVASDRTDGIARALALARKADVVVLAMGIDKSQEGEGHDRVNITLPGLQEPFAKQVLALGKPTVLVLTNGGALAIDALLLGGGPDSTAGVQPHPPPGAVVEAFNPNVVGCRGLASLLFGRSNSWGKMPYTVYASGFVGEQENANFDMTSTPGRGYRYYTGKNVIFPFGFGLSYTNFDLDVSGPSSLSLDRASDRRGFGRYRVEVKNTGTVDGDEVVMVFHRPTDSIRAAADHVLPLRRLVDFERVHVKAGESAALSFAFDKETLALSSASGASTVYPGKHELVFSRGVGQDVVVEIEA